MAIARYVFAGNLLVTGFLTGLIWYVQLVHYPLFSRVGRAEFTRYHALHSSLTTTVVVAPMLGEVALTALLIGYRPAGLPAPVAWAGLALTAIVWLATFFIAVPLHRRLGAGLEPDAVARLVRTNWIRTVAWSARFLLLLYGLVRLLP